MRYPRLIINQLPMTSEGQTVVAIVRAVREMAAALDGWEEADVQRHVAYFDAGLGPPDQKLFSNDIDGYWLARKVGYARTWLTNVTDIDSAIRQLARDDLRVRAVLDELAPPLISESVTLARNSLAHLTERARWPVAEDDPWAKAANHAQIVEGHLLIRTSRTGGVGATWAIFAPTDEALGQVADLVATVGAAIADERRGEDL